MEDKLKFKIARNIFIAVFIVLAINFLILYLVGFPQMALLQIKKYLLLLILLIVGFGTQIGLYTYLKHMQVFCSITTMASGGISGISMLLCCSHYILNILPFIILGFSNFLTSYTPYILLFGIISNIFGIFIMLRKIKQYRGKI